MSNLVTLSQLRERLSYDPGTGHLIWRNGKRPGAVAGSLEIQGYIRVKVEGKKYKAHRLAWLLIHGAWPKGEIDHVNGNKQDNRLDNLRLVDRVDNSRNQKRFRTNQSGMTGVNWIPSKRKWKALIKVHGRTIFLGYFDHFANAATARKAAESQFGFHPNHGREA